MRFEKFTGGEGVTFESEIGDTGAITCRALIEALQSTGCYAWPCLGLVDSV